MEESLKETDDAFEGWQSVRVGILCVCWGIDCHIQDDIMYRANGGRESRETYTHTAKAEAQNNGVHICNHMHWINVRKSSESRQASVCLVFMLSYLSSSSHIGEGMQVKAGSSQ